MRFTSSVMLNPELESLCLGDHAVVDVLLQIVGQSRYRYHQIVALILRIVLIMMIHRWAVKGEACCSRANQEQDSPVDPNRCGHGSTGFHCCRTTAPCRDGYATGVPGNEPPLLPHLQSWDYPPGTWRRRT